MAFNWTCPSCGSHTTIQSSNFVWKTSDAIVSTAEKHEGIRFIHFVIKCPNTECGQFMVKVEADFHECAKNAGGSLYVPSESKGLGPVGPGQFRFLPRVGQPLSLHVPPSVRSDYEEACQISDLSPKAAATLCRRALQGMVRDYWKLAKHSLAAELKAIEDRCDPGLYDAMMSLKSIGNIGAHPERDVALVVDVEPGEVQELIELLRMLDQEWYVATAERGARLARIAQMGEQKQAQRGVT